MADSMEVHAEEVGRSDDELVVQDPDFDGKTEETNAADTGSEADSVGSAPSGDGQDSPQETAPEEKPKRRRAKQPAAKDASEEEGESEPADAGPARRRTKMEAAGRFRYEPGGSPQGCPSARSRAADCPSGA